jgi:hypothetical protein
MPTPIIPAEAFVESHQVPPVGSSANPAAEGGVRMSRRAIAAGSLGSAFRQDGMLVAFGAANIPRPFRPGHAWTRCPRVAGSCCPGRTVRTTSCFTSFRRPPPPTKRSTCRSRRPSERAYWLAVRNRFAAAPAGRPGKTRWRSLDSCGRAGEFDLAGELSPAHMADLPRSTPASKSRGALTGGRRNSLVPCIEGVVWLPERNSMPPSYRRRSTFRLRKRRPK